MDRKISTQEQFEKVNTVMKAKLDLIASYIAKDMNECALMELDALRLYIDFQHVSVMDLIPGKQI